MKNKFIIILSLFISAFFLLSAFSFVKKGPDLQPPGKVKNVILMIGDGMGLTQITSGMVVNGNKLNLERFRHIGLMKTFAYKKLITDSAAGATAFSCGKKTYNGAIGVGPDTIPCRTILEVAKAKGLRTGLLATSMIQHATPAAFYAHQPSRNMYEAISLDMMGGDVDIAIGGGFKYFSRRTDSLDLVSQAEKAGYVVLTDLKKAKSAAKKSDKIWVLTDDEHPEPYAGGRGEMLKTGTQFMLDELSEGDQGFFLMIEGSQIDWGGHANDANYVNTEMVDFDRAIGKVLDFAKKNGETLVIVTADHETGGMAITGGSLEASTIEAKFNTEGHSATMVPVFAFGPGAEAFNGIYENTGIYDKMMEALGFNK
jgi:alkaline phosphatase